MSNVIGTFVFRDEGDGCLTSKYVNRGISSPVVECAKLQMRTQAEPFSGIYFVTWIEQTDRNQSSLLRIERVGEVYNLTWSNDDGVIFLGRGMLYDNLLVGCYWE